MYFYHYVSEVFLSIPYSQIHIIFMLPNLLQTKTYTRFGLSHNPKKYSAHTKQLLAEQPNPTWKKKKMFSNSFTEIHFNVHNFCSLLYLLSLSMSIHQTSHEWKVHHLYNRSEKSLGDDNDDHNKVKRVELELLQLTTTKIYKIGCCGQQKHFPWIYVGVFTTKIHYTTTLSRSPQ